MTTLDDRMRNSAQTGVRKYFYAIEPIRFIFALLICFVHFTFIGAKTVIGGSELFVSLESKFLYATTVVDFFFLISGFLLAMKHPDGGGYI